MTTFTDQVYALVSRIPRGRVVSYGGVAAMLDRPRAARAVGQALSNLPDGLDVPWWRVLDANGRISKRPASTMEAMQRRLLENEGVKFGRSGRVDWNRFGWSGPSEGEPLAAGGGQNARAIAPVKRSVAVAIRDGARSDGVLIVQRPPDDEELPDAWGLPAASLRPDELWIDAVKRAGREKLGVTLEPGVLLQSGSAARQKYRLDMRLYEARVTAGEPAVPQEDPAVTQYRAWRWGSGDDLRPAAGLGSLCCRLYLRIGDDDGAQSA